LIEWPERLGKYTPEVRLEIHLRASDEETREVMIKSIGGAGGGEGRGWTREVLLALDGMRWQY